MSVIYGGGSGNLVSLMRKWEPVRFGRVIDCNRLDLWEGLEQSAPRIIKNVKAKNVFPNLKAKI